MKKLISALPDFDFVMHHQLGPDEHAVLLRKDGAYSVCKMQPRRMIVMSPNYVAAGNGLLTAPLTKHGLTDLLQWADYEEAAERFKVMASLPDNVVSFLPDRRPIG